MVSLYSVDEIQQAFAQWSVRERKAKKLSRQALAERSGVPAATIKRFETTGEISFRQLLRIWQSLDQLNRMHALLQSAQREPQTIEEVLKGITR